MQPGAASKDKKNGRNREPIGARHDVHGTDTAVAHIVNLVSGKNGSRKWIEIGKSVC